VRIAVPALLALLVLIGLVPAPAAFGHASLVSTEPADGAIVAAAPETVTLVFNEPVSPLVLRLFAPSGHGAVLPDVKQDGPRLAIALPRAFGEGTYVLSWRVVSADGHPVSGAFGYSVGRADGAARAAMDTTANAPVRAGLWVTRFALYVALFVGVGGAFFSAWVAADRPLPGRAEPIIVAMIWIGLALYTACRRPAGARCAGRFARRASAAGSVDDRACDILRHDRGRGRAGAACGVLCR
jgi:methionine-rich copper-binding protein CopC